MEAQLSKLLHVYLYTSVWCTHPAPPPPTHTFANNCLKLRVKLLKTCLYTGGLTSPELWHIILDMMLCCSCIHIATCYRTVWIIASIQQAFSLPQVLSIRFVARLYVLWDISHGVVWNARQRGVCRPVPSVGLFLDQFIVGAELFLGLENKSDWWESIVLKNWNDQQMTAELWETCTNSEECGFWWLPVKLITNLLRDLLRLLWQRHVLLTKEVLLQRIIVNLSQGAGQPGVPPCPLKGASRCKEKCRKAKQIWAGFALSLPGWSPTSTAQSLCKGSKHNNIYINFANGCHPVQHN